MQEIKVLATGDVNSLMPDVSKMFIIIGLSNGLVPIGTKPLHKPYDDFVYFVT